MSEVSVRGGRVQFCTQDGAEMAGGATLDRSIS